MRVIEWANAASSQDYRAPYFPAAQTYWRREFQLVASFAKDGQSLAIGPESHVQWSEFLLRRPSDLGELSEMVGGMVEGMTVGGPDALLTMHQLHATEGLSVGLLGKWSDENGFHVFEQDETFGDDPYWSDYADNAHWMMRVLSIQ